MTRPGPVLCLLIFSVLISPLHKPPAAQEASPKDIIDHIDDLYRDTSSHAVMTLRVVTGDYSRDMKIEAWSKGKKYTLVRAMEPSRQRRASTMKLGNSIWSYLPEVDRVIKIPLSMMGASWMGSHFTNDDVVRKSMLGEDYTGEISFSGTRQGQEVIELVLTPMPAAAAVWGKVTATVRRSDWIPLRIDFSGGAADTARTMTFSDIRNLGGRRLPATLRIAPDGNVAEYSEITYEAIRFDVDIDKGFFSLKNLKSQEMP